MYCFFRNVLDAAYGDELKEKQVFHYSCGYDIISVTLTPDEDPQVTRNNWIKCGVRKCTSQMETQSLIFNLGDNVMARQLSSEMSAGWGLVPMIYIMSPIAIKDSSDDDSFSQDCGF